MSSFLPNIGDALTEVAKQRHSASALRFPEANKILTFAEWHDQSLRLAGGLMSSDLRPGDHLALLAKNRIEWPVV